MWMWLHWRREFGGGADDSNHASDADYGGDRAGRFSAGDRWDGASMSGGDVVGSV